MGKGKGKGNDNLKRKVHVPKTQNSQRKANRRFSHAIKISLIIKQLLAEGIH